MRGGRGQVTLFFAIGLALLLLVGILLVVMSIINRDEQGSGVIDQTRDSAAGAAIASAIGSCIDTVVHDELRIIGESGALPVSDGYPRGFAGRGTTNRTILYGLTANRDMPGQVLMLPYAVPPPEYPLRDIDFASIQEHPDRGPFASFQPGYFGDLHFPPVCERDGPNGIGRVRACRYYAGIPPMAAGEPPLQRGLKDRILQRVQQCASPRAFEDALGRTVLSVGTPVLTLAFTQSNIIITLDYPLQLEGETQARSQRVTKTYDVRLLPIIEYAIDLALIESRDPFFNISTDADRLASFRQGFSVDRGRVNVARADPALTPALRTQADLISITDRRSTINGQDYTFSFLIEHRAPMLENVTQDCVSFLQKSVQEHIEERTLQAVDPDDMGVTIRACAGAQDAGICHPTNLTIVAVDGDGEKDWFVTICDIWREKCDAGSSDCRCDGTC